LNILAVLSLVLDWMPDLRAADSLADPAAIRAEFCLRALALEAELQRLAREDPDELRRPVFVLLDERVPRPGVHAANAQGARPPPKPRAHS